MNGTGPLETGEKIEMDWCPGGAMETGKETYLQAGAAASGMEEVPRGTMSPYPPSAVAGSAS